MRRVSVCALIDEFKGNVVWFVSTTEINKEIIVLILSLLKTSKFKHLINWFQRFLQNFQFD